MKQTLHFDRAELEKVIAYYVLDKYKIDCSNDEIQSINIDDEEICEINIVLEVLEK